MKKVIRRASRELLPPPSAAASHGAQTTRERLLAATHELLSERGGGPVSVNEICSRAGVNVAMVKYCFGNKDGLMQALIDRVADGFIQDLKRLDALRLAPPERLTRHVEGIVTNYVRYPYINRLVNLQLLSTDPDGVDHFARSYALPMRDWYARVLKEGARSGAFRPVDPVLFFFTVLGMAEFFFTGQPLLRGAFGKGEMSPATIKAFSRHTTEMMLHGVLAEKTRSRVPPRPTS